MTELLDNRKLLPKLPDADTFGPLVLPSAPRHRALKQLLEILVTASPDTPLADRVRAVEKLGYFLSSRRAVPAVEGAPAGESPQILRLRLFVRALESSPELRTRFCATLESIFVESIEGGLFSRVGLPTDRGFLAETVDRVSRRFLPEPREDRDLLELVARLLPGRSELRILAATPPDLIRTLLGLLRDPDHDIDPWTPLRVHLLEAIGLLPMRIAAAGLSDVLRARSPRTSVEDSPFFKLPRAVDRLLDQARNPELGADADAADALRISISTCLRLIDECRAVTASVVENLEQFGVSVDVVYRLELVGKNLGRLASLIRTLEPGADLLRARQAKTLLVEITGLRLQDRDLTDIVRDNLHLLARKIIERAGHTGEHYITSSRGDYFKMLLSAGGGGVLTAGTTALKYLIGWAHFAPFVEGMLSATNYAGSFIVMQLLGFTLATKQPSMTAAALAGTLRETASHPDLSALVTMIARIVRSQLAAAIGNIGLVIPAAFVFDFAWRMRTGAPFLDPATAEYILHSLHPTRSGTIFYAALTGVLLWMSSIFAGWVENWAVYRRLPEAIHGHRLGRFVGVRTMAACSRFFSRNVAGFGGNSALGFLLGMTPVMGKFFGLPLDVRHVTLSTGALTLALCSLDGELYDMRAVVAAAVGIAIIGSLNFGVSFVLALAVALRARQVDRSDRLRLLVSILATFVRSPFQFVFPPRSDAPPVHGPVSVSPQKPPTD